MKATTVKQKKKSEPPFLIGQVQSRLLGMILFHSHTTCSVIL